MAGTVYFSISELLPILDHAEAAPAQQPSFEQLCDETLWKPGTLVKKGGYCSSEDIDQSKVAPQVFVVKDEGCYIMSAGNPAQLIGEGERRRVVYADGCDPDKSPDCWNHVQALCGGDDFGIDVPTAVIRSVIANVPGAHRLCVTFGKRDTSFTAF